MSSSKFLRHFLNKRNVLTYQLFIYIGVNQGGDLIYQEQLAEYFHKSLSTVNYHIIKFRKEGLLSDFLNLTEEGKKLFKFLWEKADAKILRAHNIVIKFNLIKCPVDYVKRYVNEIFVEFGNGKYKGLKGKQKGITYMLYSTKKIVCVVPDIFADTDEEISVTMQLITQEMKEIIEAKFVGVLIGGHSLGKIQKSHIAILDAYTTKIFDLENTNYTGKEIALDKSHDKYEFELIDPKTNLRTIEDLKLLDEMLRKSK